MVQQTSLKPVDDEIIQKIGQCTDETTEDWSFKDHSTREHVHALFQYPGMMVPEMQKKLLQAITESQEGISRVIDPYVGSGTILTECMLRGLDFQGQDLNPLAILL